MEWVKQIKICLSGSFSLPIHDLFIREVNKKTGNKAIKHKAKNFFYAHIDFKLPLTYFKPVFHFYTPWKPFVFWRKNRSIWILAWNGLIIANILYADAIHFQWPVYWFQKLKAKPCSKNKNEKFILCTCICMSKNSV